MKRFIPRLLPIAASVLAACQFAPDYTPPVVVTPPAYKESSDWHVAAPRDNAPRGAWWKVFGDPVLDGLEDRVGTANQTLKAAVARYDEARADAKDAQADYYPTLDAQGSAARTGLSRNVPNPLPNRSYRNYSLGLDLDYEIDVWGRVRNQVRAGQDRAQASAADLATIDLSLRAELATDYFILRGYDAEQETLDRTVINYRKALELTQARFNVGYAARRDVSAADAQFQTASTAATEVRLKRSNLEHAIAVLTGQPPAGFALAPQRFDTVPVEIAVTLPAALLERRPDIAAAERRAAAANADIGIARAAYFPAFNLNALFGVQSTTAGNLFSAPAEAWTLGPAAVLTLFDGGRRRALNDRAHAAYDESAAQYRQTVLDAYREVEDSLASLRLLAQETATQHAAVTAAADATSQATGLYSGGLDNYYNVIVAQNVELNARLGEIDIHTRRMTANVSLIKALGGGWDRDSGLDESVQTEASNRIPPSSTQR
jgi:outer membrane protein, multidrug efflux system